MPVSKSTPHTVQWFHQSQHTRPGLIHDVAASSHRPPSTASIPLSAMSASLPTTAKRHGSERRPCVRAMQGSSCVTAQLRSPRGSHVAGERGKRASRALLPAGARNMWG